jgi:DNA topoisomerase IB
MERTFRPWFRVGSERYTKRHRTFGITTLNKNHVSQRPETERLHPAAFELDLEERALLSLLRSWRIRQSRAAA